MQKENRMLYRDTMKTYLINQKTYFLLHLYVKLHPNARKFLSDYCNEL